MEEITKIYPNGFIANRNVTFSVNENEIHALVGENGAGKTTLMKILFGMENCQTGKIYISGEEVHITSPLDAIAKGIGMVHQHFYASAKPDRRRKCSIGNGTGARARFRQETSARNDSRDQQQIQSRRRL